MVTIIMNFNIIGYEKKEGDNKGLIFNAKVLKVGKKDLTPILQGKITKFPLTLLKSNHKILPLLFSKEK